MPRLRAIKKPEDSAKVPLDQGVEVHLQPEQDIEADNNLPDDKQQQQVQKPVVQPQDDDGIATLKKQLEDSKKVHEEALAAANKRAEDAERQRQEALRQAQDREVKLSEADSQRTEAELDAVMNAIAAAQSEADSAQQLYEAAMNEGNFKIAAEVQRKLARAETRLTQLEDGKVVLEARIKENKEKPKPTQQQKQPATVDEYIDGLQGLVPAERTWLKAHPDLMMNNDRNGDMQYFYRKAQKDGLIRGTPEFFQYMEENLGYRQAGTEDDDEPVTNNRRTPVAAPPSRDNTSLANGKISTTKITLSPAQREAAKAAGVDEIEYAKQLMKLMDMKQQGHYNS